MRGQFFDDNSSKCIISKQYIKMRIGIDLNRDDDVWINLV